MNGKKAKALRKISKAISIKENIDEKNVYKRIKRISNKNKKIKV